MSGGQEAATGYCSARTPAYRHQLHFPLHVAINRIAIHLI
jgi:hypothetical protein